MSKLKNTFLMVVGSASTILATIEQRTTPKFTVKACVFVEMTVVKNIAIMI